MFRCVLFTAPKLLLQSLLVPQDKKEPDHRIHEVFEVRSCSSHILALDPQRMRVFGLGCGVLGVDTQRQMEEHMLTQQPLHAPGFAIISRCLTTSSQPSRVEPRPTFVNPAESNWNLEVKDMANLTERFVRSSSDRTVEQHCPKAANKGGWHIDYGQSTEPDDARHATRVPPPSFQYCASPVSAIAHMMRRLTYTDTHQAGRDSWIGEIEKAWELHGPRYCIVNYP